MTDSEEKKRLDKVADWYIPGKDRVENARINYLSGVIAANVKGPSVLEMGCSEGIMTKILADNFSNLYVVDGSEKYIDNAKKAIKRGNIKFFVSLFENFNPKEKFDDIIMSHILEHVKDPVFILKNARKWLKGDGRIHIAAPNARSLHRIISQKMGIIKKFDDPSENDIKVGHRRVYDRKSMERDIKKSGLRAVRYEGIFLKPFSSSRMNALGGKILDAFLEAGKMFPDNCSTIYYVCKK